MTHLGTDMIWCAIQVTLFTSIAAVIYLAVRFPNARTGARALLGGLLIVIMLSGLTFSPWPNWSAAVDGWTTPSPPPAISSPKIPRTTLESGHSIAESSALAEPSSAPSPVGGKSSSGTTSGIPLADLFRSLWNTLRDMPVETSVPAAKADSFGWNWRTITVLVLLASTALGLARLVTGLLAVVRLNKQSHRIIDPQLMEMLDVIRAELGCTRSIELRESPNLATAATVGWRRPVILLPASWRTWSPSGQRIVLAHELAHVRHSDFLLHALGQLSVALHFYHPLVHWLARRLRLEQELAADTMAAQVTGGQQIYLMTLANIALAQPNIRVGWPAHAFLPTRGMFLRRIEMLRNKKYNPNPPGGFSMATQSIAFCLLAVAGLVVAGLRGTANEGSSESDSTSITAQDPRTFLEFHLAESNPRENLMKAILDHNKETVYLHKDPVLTGQHVTSAQVVNIDSNQPAVVVTFTEEGQQILKKVTTDHQGKRLAVLVDGKIVTAPTIRATISKVALITGNFDRAEAERIANFFFPTKRDARKTVDFSYIPEDAAWFFAVRPADMFKVKCFQPVLEMADAEMAITDGFSWSQIEQLSVVWTLVPAADLRTNSERTIVRVTPDVDLPSVHAALARMKTVHEPREETIAGTRIYVDSRSDQPSRPAYYVADAQTLVFDRYDRIVNLVRGDETAIDPEQITAIDDTQGALGIAYAQGSQFRVRILPELRRQAKDIPSGLAMLLPVVEKTDTGLLIARVNADLEITGTAVCPSAQDATGVAKAIESLISMMHHWIIARTEGPGGFEDAVGKGSSQDERSSGPTMFESQLVALSKVLVKNAHLTVVDKQAKMTTSCEPDLADLFVAMGPSIRKGREAARRALCINNLKQIALLFLLYENQMGSYPPAVFYGPDGKTPYSWRVAILPYLGAQEIYDQYKFDEPWDGPNNIKLLDKMPAIYRHPKDNSQSTNTSYFVLTGPETVFSSKEGVKLREVLDGTHFTLLVVEAKRDVPWTKPEDIPYASDQPLPELGGWQWSLGGPDGFCVARCDGSVDFLVEDRNDEAEFRAMITKAGGETIRSNSKVAPARNR